MRYTLQLQVHDLRGTEGTAEAQERGHTDDGCGRAGGGDDGAHAQRQDELGEEHHAADDGDVGAEAAHLRRAGQGVAAGVDGELRGMQTVQTVENLVRGKIYWKLF